MFRIDLLYNFGTDVEEGLPLQVILACAEDYKKYLSDVEEVNYARVRISRDDEALCTVQPMQACAFIHVGTIHHQRLFGDRIINVLGLEEEIFLIPEGSNLRFYSCSGISGESLEQLASQTILPHLAYELSCSSTDQLPARGDVGSCSFTIPLDSWFVAVFTLGTLFHDLLTIILPWLRSNPANYESDDRADLMALLETFYTSFPRSRSIPGCGT
jgi:hypothetical protein